MDLPSSGWATFWPAYMQDSMQNMHYFPNAAIYPKRKSRMMDGILREALGKYGIYPAEVEQSVAHIYALNLMYVRSKIGVAVELLTLS